MKQKNFFAYKSVLFTICLILSILSSYGQCNNFTTISSSSTANQTFAIKNDGTLWIWGYGYVAPLQIGTANNWESISAGARHVLGITSDGKLWAFGSNSNWQLGIENIGSSDIPVQVGTATNWVSISAGDSHSLAVTADGKLWAWGTDFFGELGGANGILHVPAQIGTETNWLRVSAGLYNSFAIKTDGRLFAWGRNSFGQLGDGTNTDRHSPTYIGPDYWVSVVAGGGHTLGITSEGKLKAWGNNNSGQLGNYTNTNSNTPIQIGPGINWVSVEAGSEHSLGLTADGKLLAWGNNTYGQLGDGTTINKNNPTQIGMATNWVSISSGQFHSSGIRSDGKILGWGNTLLEVGTPIPITGLAASGSSATMIQGHYNVYNNNCAIIAAVNNKRVSLQPIVGSVTANVWVEASQPVNYVKRHFQIIPTTNESEATGTVTLYFTQEEFDSFNAINAIKLPKNSTDIAGKVNILIEKRKGSSTNGTGLPSSYTGAYETIKPTDYDIIWNATDNLWEISFDVTGFGGFFVKTQRAPLPFQCTLFKTITTSSHASHNLGIKNDDGTLWAWGNNSDWQLGDGTKTTRYFPTQIGTAANWVSIATGGSHSLGITADGKLWAWGRNHNGQLGDGTDIIKESPVQVGTASNWHKISAGANHSLGITADGKLWEWGVINGKNIPTQVGLATNWVRISAGTLNSYGITADGKLWVFGSNAPVQIGTATNWVDISASYSNSVGITADGKLWALGSNTPVQIGTASNWVSVSAGSSHSLGISADGKLWGWGNNTYGQLGDGTTDNKNLPTQIGTSSDWISISAGFAHSVGIKADMGPVGFGFNDDGRVGIGRTGLFNYILNPAQIINTSNFSDLAATGAFATMEQGQYNIYTHNCSLIAAVSNTSKSLTPIVGLVTAKVWIDPTQAAQIVKRHYEITPASNSTIATGKITLYFTQQDFDDFNAINTTKLPTDVSDATGIANLLIEKREGISSDGTGLPNSYSGTVTSINPNDAHILWNSTTNRWEVSFDVTGFGGFFVKTTNATSIHYVKPAPEGTGDGSSWANASSNIATMVGVSNIGDQVWVAAGTYTPTATLNMKNGVAIYGGFAGTETQIIQRNFTANPTIISGGDVRQVFNNSNLDNTAVLDGCIISNGNSTTNGAGMNNSYASPTIRNCVFRENACNSTVNEGGGAMYNSYSNPNITNCVFANNTVNNGLYGGGMQNDNSNPTINNCIFTGNQALGFEGGGGVGGGLCNFFSNPIINNSVFTGNSAPDSDGGGIYDYVSNTIITNTIIYGNSAASNPNFISYGGSPIVTYSDIEGAFVGTGNVNTDPLFVNAALPAGTDGIWMTADDGLAMQPCSPLINAGTTTNPTLPTDIFGNARVGAYDMGAYEYQGNASGLAPEAGSQNATSTNTQSGITIYNGCSNSHLIATILSNGDSPIGGSTTAKVWVETTQPTQFVKRHYEITPDADNATIATGRITLYFTQTEFTDFNAQTPAPTYLLPSGPADALGIANLRIEKHPGTSSDGTGLPGTYSGTVTSINPNDANIIWNSTNSRWEITFEVTGFSGFFVNAASSAPLPVNLISFEGKSTENGNLLNWKTANEKNFSHFEIERSPLAPEGGIVSTKFEKISRQTANESGNYEFLDKTSSIGGGGGFYRLKMIDLDGKYSYSKIIAIDNMPEKALIGQVYPNPSTGSANIQINAVENGNWTISLVDITGKILQTFTKNLSKGSQTISLENLQQGLNYIKIESGKVLEFRKVIKN